MSIQREPELLTVAQAAFLLQVSRRTIHRHIKNGTLPAHKFLGEWSIPKDAISAGIRTALDVGESQ